MPVYTVQVPYPKLNTVIFSRGTMAHLIIIIIWYWLYKIPINPDQHSKLYLQSDSVSNLFLKSLIEAASTTLEGKPLHFLIHFENISFWHQILCAYV